MLIPLPSNFQNVHNVYTMTTTFSFIFCLQIPKNAEFPMETLQNAPIKTISRKTYANINNSRKTGVSFFCSAFLRAIVCFQRIQNLILCI
jgi:hypothetical protein